MNPFNDFHEETRRYQLSRIRDRVQGNKNREKYFISGGVPNHLPKPEPQGSFTQLFYNYNRPDSHLSGGFRNETGQQWGQSQLKKRADQLTQLQAVATGQMEQSATAINTASEELTSVLSSLELFFTDVRDSDFSDDTTKMSDIRQALGNLRKYGVELSRSTLERFSQIMQVSLGTFIRQMKEGFNPQAFEMRGFPRARATITKYKTRLLISYLEHMDTYELLYKVYLVLMALMSSLDLPKASRQIAFAQQYKDIIRAKTSEVAPEEFQEVQAIAQQGLKELKALAPSSVYEAIKKTYPNWYKMNRTEQPQAGVAEQKNNDVEDTSDEEESEDESTDGAVSV